MFENASLHKETEFNPIYSEEDSPMPYRNAGSLSTQAKLPQKEQAVSKQVIRVGLKMQHVNKLNNKFR